MSGQNRFPPLAPPHLPTFSIKLREDAKACLSAFWAEVLQDILHFNQAGKNNQVSVTVVS